MTVVFELVLAFAAGLTACGLAGSAMEAVAGRRLSFAPPFVSSVHVLRSLAVTAAAGPYMLVNDVIAARRAGLPGSVLWSGLAIGAVWVLAVGIVAVDLARRTAVLLS